MIKWRDVVGFPGYQVNSIGDVKGPLKILDQRADRKGYLSVSMRRNGVLHKRTVARLVAEAFLGPRPDGQQVRHKSGIKTDNCFSNLEYGTQADNEHDKRRHGTAPIGINHPSAKIDESHVRAIRARYVPYHAMNGAAAIAREYGLTQNTVSKIVNRKLWSHVACPATAISGCSGRQATATQTAHWWRICCASAVMLWPVT